MAIPQDRLSTELVAGVYLSPDGRERAWTEDYEAGPIALNDPSQGLSYQNWRIYWEAGDFIVTSETTLDSAVVLTVASVKQCSFAFDQNGHVNITYTLNNDEAYLYWYDTNAAMWVQDLLSTGTTFPMLCLDDKRTTQTQASDVQLWYTKQQIDTTYNLYMREQRERYLNEQLMAQDTYPHPYKLGMHNGLRVQLELRSIG